MKDIHVNQALSGVERVSSDNCESPGKVFVRIFDLSPAKLGRNLNSRKESSNGVIISDTKPILGIYVQASALEFTTLDGMLHNINAILVKEKSEKVTPSLINQLRSPNLRLELSSELVCDRGKPRQSLLSRRVLQNDADVSATGARLRALWAAAHTTANALSEDNDPSTTGSIANDDKNLLSPAISDRNKSTKPALPIYQLALPNLPLKIHQADHEIVYVALSIYISNEGEPVAVPEDTLDPLSKAVHTMSAVPSRNDLCLRDGPALWLSRLDPRALQRYAVELTENLASSITAAFESPEI